MLRFNIKKIKINYLDYFSKLVLKKNLQNKFASTSNTLYKFNSKSNSNTVTLRAPKHFKVGRHHYHTITRRCYLLFRNFKINSFISNAQMYSYLRILCVLLKKKKLSKILSLLTCLTATVCITDSFYVI